MKQSFWVYVYDVSLDLFLLQCYKTYKTNSQMEWFVCGCITSKPHTCMHAHSMHVCWYIIEDEHVRHLCLMAQEEHPYTHLLWFL